MFDHLPFSPATGTNPYFSTVLLEKGGNLDGSHILTYRRGRALCSTSRVRVIVYPGIHTSRVQGFIEGRLPDIVGGVEPCSAAALFDH